VKKQEFSMTTDTQTLLKTTLTLLQSVAPEVDAQTLQLATPLRRQVDLDSMDWLNFLISLHQHFGVIIPEADYARLVSLNDVVNYLQAKLAAA
jgi:acyl carrier protein